MATATHNHATYRTVVLLRSSEKKRLEKLARQEKVSSSEIVRRSIQAYESSSSKEQQEVQSLVAEMNTALDKALEAVRSARTEVAENIAQIKKRKTKRA